MSVYNIRRRADGCHFLDWEGLWCIPIHHDENIYLCTDDESKTIMQDVFFTRHSKLLCKAKSKKQKRIKSNETMCDDVMM